MFNITTEEISKKELRLEKYNSIKSIAIIKFNYNESTNSLYEQNHYIEIKLNQDEYLAEVLMYGDVIKDQWAYPIKIINI